MQNTLRAFGVVCYRCGSSAGPRTREGTGRAFIVLYVRALRRVYEQSRLATAGSAATPSTEPV